MKLIRYLVIILLVICGVWYYITSHVASEMNRKYAGQQLSVKELDKKDYFITFEEVAPEGFPFKISWRVKGWMEESRKANLILLSSKIWL